MATGDIPSSNENLRAYCRELGKEIPLNNRFLLVKGPQLNLAAFEAEVAQNRCYYAYPPTGLQYLAAAVEARGLQVKILDLNFLLLRKIVREKGFDYANWLKLLDDCLAEFKPAIVGVSNSFSIDTPSFMEILNHLRAKQEKYLILAGGQNATYNGQTLLEEGLCHFVFEREAENKINYFLDQFQETGPNHPATPGILFKYRGIIEQSSGPNDQVTLTGNLKTAHQLVPIEEYCRVGTLSPYSRMSGKDNPFATVMLNRGCEGGCKFCGVVDFMGKGVRSREVHDVLDEIEYLYRQRGIRHIEWLDDDFARYRERAGEVLDGIIQRGLKISWASNNGFIARTLDETLMAKMRDSGCLGFKIGVESGNAELLKKVHKPGTLKTFREFSQRARKFPELFIADNYILGFPEETFQQILDTFRFSLEMDLDWSSYAVYQHNVNFFGSKREESNVIGDFIPTKDSSQGKLNAGEYLREGRDVFTLPLGEPPSREQVKQIWFTFNLTRNYIQNKNLKSGGRPEKFIAWTTCVQERYPTNAYMSFFLALANFLAGNPQEAQNQHLRTLSNLEDTYWKKRFDQFEITPIMNAFPKDKTQAEDALENLRKKHHGF